MAAPNQIVYDLNQVVFEYKPNQPVLAIKQLQIEQGLTFVLGKSGIGKSTLIEALGLMNNTFGNKAQSKNGITAYKSAESNYDLQQFWQESDVVISQFRKEHFSFIFQQTNLMPNLTAGENMIISKLIQGIDIKTARAEVINIMRQVGLDATLFDREIANLSGGQRQRLTFIRAIAADFNVLFGDEPTGNLDRFTAEQLMDVLQAYIHNKHKAGIIVSHDIDLALNYADRIVLIAPKKKNKELEYGYIDQKQVIHSRDDAWFDYQNNIITKPIEYIHSLLNSTVPNVATV